MKRVAACVLFALSEGFKLWPEPELVTIENDVECCVDAAFSFSISSTLTNGHMDRLRAMSDSVSGTIARFGLIRKSCSAAPCGTNSCRLTVESPESPFSSDVDSEGFTIRFNAVSGCSIACPTAYGCMHGLKTFLQTLDPLTGLALPQSFQIQDKPQFSYRGVMIDSGRHFLPVDAILTTLRLMSESKLNVLHWHLTDHQSFPLGSEVFPLLPGKGAFSPNAVYSKTDVETVVTFASSLGIRVVPELDIPSHTDSWFKGYPELRGDALWAIDPTRPENYKFLATLLAEVKEWFHSDVFAGSFLMHLGMHEVRDGWDSDAVRAWMKATKIDSKEKLVKYWMRRMVGIAAKLDMRIMMWEDFLKETDDDVSAFNEAGSSIAFQVWQRSMDEAVEISKNAQRDVVFSTYFYLDHLGKTWETMYETPVSAGLLGAEACMWGERADATNLVQRMWPKAAALAERLWCGSRCPLDATTAAVRLAKWRCRMKEFLGFNVGPLGVVRPAVLDEEWTGHTDRMQWYCRERDL